MSLSQPRTKNPSTKFIEFKNGQFSHYDKEKQKNIEIPLPITFIRLDELSTVVGFSEKDNCGIYSNEVFSTKDETLVVKTSKGAEIARGIYGEIKDTIKAEGGKYAKSVYAILNGELVNFKLYGASLSPWIDLKAFDTNPVIKVEKTADEKKGSNEYKVPVFEFSTAKEEEIEKAKEIDKELQVYLQSRGIEKKRTEVSQPDLPEPKEEEIKIDDLPFSPSETTENYEECPHCHKMKPDVITRPDHYAQDINDEQGATMTCCEECEQDNSDDI